MGALRHQKRRGQLTFLFTVVRMFFLLIDMRRNEMRFPAIFQTVFFLTVRAYKHLGFGGIVVKTGRKNRKK